MRPNTQPVDDRRSDDGAARFASVVRACFVRVNIRRPAQGWCIPEAR